MAHKKSSLECVLVLRCGIRYVFNRINFIYLSNFYDARDYWVVFENWVLLLSENFLIGRFFYLIANIRLLLVEN